MQLFYRAQAGFHLVRNMCIYRLGEAAFCEVRVALTCIKRLLGNGVNFYRDLIGSCSTGGEQTYLLLLLLLLLLHTFYGAPLLRAGIPPLINQSSLRFRPVPDFLLARWLDIQIAQAGFNVVGRVVWYLVCHQHERLSFPSSGPHIGEVDDMN